MTVRSTWLLPLLVAGCAARHPPRAPTLTGPRAAEIDLYRPYEQADKLYVLADPGDGKERFFLVDTGASISVITPELAAALHLKVNDEGNELIGLGGRATWNRSVLPELKLGPYTVPDVEIAVGVPGLPVTAGLAPVAGIIGNNVWGMFQMAVDYPANLLELARPGHMKIPPGAAPMVFNGQHVTTAVTLLVRTPEGGTAQATLPLEIDTGARGLVMSGQGAAALAPWSTAAQELIIGIGAADDLPASNFYQDTRRVSLSGVSLGGATVTRDMEATWINYAADRTAVGPPGMSGLIGHEVLDGYRVTFDYSGGKFAITPSTHKPAFHDMHEHEERALRKSREPADIRDRAVLLAEAGDTDAAIKVLDHLIQQHPDDMEAHVTRARLRRFDGDVDGALRELRALPPAALAEQGAIVEVVNGLWLAGDEAAALSMAEAATSADDSASESWVALADVALRGAQVDRARQAVSRTNRLNQSPDGQLWRRALIASAEGDHLGALTHARRLVEGNPNFGASIWLYGTLAEGTDDVAMFSDDLSVALHRLYPEDRPYDFAAAGLLAAGRPREAAELALLGMARDCGPLTDPAALDNCQAWYKVMGGLNLDEASAAIERAVALSPDRVEYLDTLATVRAAQGRYAEARDAAWKAAARAPDDVYLLWQASRLQTRSEKSTRE